MLAVCRILLLQCLSRKFNTSKGQIAGSRSCSLSTLTELGLLQKCSSSHSTFCFSRIFREMSIAVPSASSSALFAAFLQGGLCKPTVRLLPHFGTKLRTSYPRIRASLGNSPSVETDARSELDAVSNFSEIVPDTVIFDDFDRFPPTAATVSSSLLLGISGLPDTKFKSAIETALADSGCYTQEDPSDRLSCFYSKALVNVGAELAKLVPGRVSTEVDARLSYNTHGIIRKVHELLNLYSEVAVPPERLLFKIPSTWQGIEASRVLESEGIQTHMTFVYSFPQAAAAAQSGASVIQIFVGRLRDWARNHPVDPETDASGSNEEDPGIALVTKAYNYIHKHGLKSKLMAAAIRNKQDIFSLLGVDYIIAPLKILESLKESITLPDSKYSFMRRLSPTSAMRCGFTKEELVKWDQLTLVSEMGRAAEELLTAGIDGYVTQTNRVEELFGKIWPPPNV